MNYTTLLEEIAQYVEKYYNDRSTETVLLYHNLSHTSDVVNAAQQIAHHYQLNDRDFFVVVAAAWFHDTGYFTSATEHEKAGAGLAKEFLQAKGVSQDDINTIEQCILATKIPQQPKNLLEQIVCDADLFHLGTEAFGDKNKLLRKEMEMIYHKEIDKDLWRLTSIKFLQSHFYHTDYAKVLLNDQKQKNLDKLIHKAREKENTILPPVTTVAAEPEPAGDGKKKKKDDRPERGIETMFRISSNNHQRLSDMADSKAHIMISVNSIIISILLSVLFRKIEDYPHLTIPATLLLMVSLITMVFSILATRPTIPRGTFTQEDIDKKKVNLLFFGNFYRMTYDEYANGMFKMMNDRDFLYGSLTKDVYSQGIVLGRKYRMLRASYNVFMFGLIISVAAFVIASVAYGK